MEEETPPGFQDGTHQPQSLQGLALWKLHELCWEPIVQNTVHDPLGHPPPPQLSLHPQA